MKSTEVNVMSSDGEHVDGYMITTGENVTVEHILLQAWVRFYGEALDNGQTPGIFHTEFIDDEQIEVTLSTKSNLHPVEDVEVFRLRISL
jgi:hypothetical protein